MRTCPGCDEEMEDTGLALDDVGTVQTYRCRWCAEDFLERPRPADGWREGIRAAVREYRAGAR